MNDLVAIRDLRIDYETARGIVCALDGVDLSVGPSQELGIVGESGSGKSSLVHAGLIPELRGPQQRSFDGACAPL